MCQDAAEQLFTPETQCLLLFEFKFCRSIPLHISPMSQSSKRQPNIVLQQICKTAHAAFQLTSYVASLDADIKFRQLLLVQDLSSFLDGSSEPYTRSDRGLLS